MSEKIRKIVEERAKTDSSGRWVSIEDVCQLLKEVTDESITAVKNTGKQCAYTTHDYGVVGCTIAKSVQILEDLYK